MLREGGFAKAIDVTRWKKGGCLFSRSESTFPIEKKPRRDGWVFKLLH